MNIFILDNDMQKSVESYVDRHIVKMPLESTQLLSNVYYHTNQSDIAPYKLTHVNHPCLIWARTSLSNWVWLRDFTLKMCKEYTYRYGRHHACEAIVERMITPHLPDIGLTTFVQAMPDQYKNSNAIIAYRQYYNGEKQHLFNWKNRKVPEWIIGGVK